MSIFSLARKAWTELRARGSGDDPQEKLWYPMVTGMGRKTIAGELVTEDNALRCLAVYACIRVIAEDIAKIPMYLYKHTKDGGKERVFNPTADLFLREANPEMSAFDFERTLEGHKGGWGNGYAEIEWKKSGQPLALHPLAPQCVRPKRLSDGRLVYEYRNLKTNTARDIDAADIFHLKGWGSDGIVGYSPIRVAAEAIGLSMAQQDFGAGFYGNGATPGVILKHPASLKQDAKDRLRESWDMAHSGPDNSHKTVVLDGGLEVEKMTINPQDAQFLEGQQFSVESIARLYRVPPHKIQHLLRSTFSNIESQNIEYITDCLHPVAIAWEQEADRKLNIPPDHFFKHDFNELLRGDAVSRVTYYQGLRNIGVLDANEIRASEDMNPREGGDVLLVQGAMTTIEMVKSGGNFAKSGANTGPNDAKSAPDKGKNASKLAKIAEFHEQLLAEFLTRALKIESERVSKAAKKPGFDAWKAEFYVSHGDHLTAGMRSIIHSYCEAGAQLDFAPVDAELAINEFRSEHINGSKMSLSPSTADSIVMGWTEIRAKHSANRWIKYITQELTK